MNKTNVKKTKLSDVQVLYVILLAIGQHLAYLAFNFPVLQ